MADHFDFKTVPVPGLQRVLDEFVQWVATNRAYNGTDHEHGQALYNECLNVVLPVWAADFLAEKM